MKKLIALMLVLTMVLSFAACGEKQEEKGSSLRDVADKVETDRPAKQETRTPETEESEEPEVETTQQPAKPEGGFTMEETVVVDNDECIIKITGIEVNDFDEVVLKLYLENKSADKTYMFSVNDATVNGVGTSPLFATEVAPGKKAMKDMSFWDSALEENGITRFTDIGLSFWVHDANDFMADPVAEPSLHVYPYGEDQAERFVRERKDTDIVLVDNEDATVLVIGTEYDEIWGQSVKLYVENKTDTHMMCTIDEVSVNGFMVDPFFASEIAPDSCGFTNINWSNEHLEENGISELEEIEGVFRLYDSDDWSAPDFFREKVSFQP